MEVSEQLAAPAAARLKRLDYENIAVTVGDGYYGWAERGPYDGILVKEAADHVPEPLLAQLKPGGRMVVPVGSGDSEQDLTVIEKDELGKIHRTGPILVSALAPVTCASFSWCFSRETRP